jgi:hypothetical protein
MIENLLAWLPRFLLPVWQKLLDRLFPNGSRATRLIFIEQPWTSWAYGDDAIQLHLLLNVTNESDTDALLVSRVQVQVRLTGWKFLQWQDCMLVDIGGRRLMPGFVGRRLPPRTTTAIRIIHPYKSERPKPGQPIKCRLRVTDQQGRLHSKRLTVPSR